MNSVFHQLKAEFTANKSYKGTDIHSTIMETIKVGGWIGQMCSLGLLYRVHAKKN